MFNGRKKTLKKTPQTFPYLKIKNSKIPNPKEAKKKKKIPVTNS